MSIFIAILIFTAVVVFHELGHFLLAKKSGIVVNEFSAGMGPKVVSYVKDNNGKRHVFFFKWKPDFFEKPEYEGRTIYSWKLFPIGGACMMKGELEEEGKDISEGSFNAATVWQRIATVAAGPIFNFILAYFLAMFIVGFAGYDSNKITETALTEGYPMQEAGLMPGDYIVKYDGSNIHSIRELSLHLQLHPVTKDPVMVTYRRDGEKHTVEVVPVLDEETGRYKIGMSLATVREKANALEIIRYSGREVRFWIVSTVESLAQMIRGKVKADDISGPVGIVNMIGTTYTESKQISAMSAFLSMINISILLSANLGVMNLLPIPALDGGRLVFLIIEAIRRKPMDQSKEAVIHMIGFVALMALMVFILFNDVRKLI